MRLWIDTDIGTNPDDAIALLCAAGHPDVDLVGVSTVDGDTEWRAEIARTLVDAPVVPGAQLTVRDIAAAHSEAMLAIGPLVNVARLLASGALPPHVCVMGGAVKSVHHRGAVRDVEHNFGTEPAAARAVIEHTPGLLLCPLDVTVRMRPSAVDLRAIVEAAPVVGPMLDDWRARQRARASQTTTQRSGSTTRWLCSRSRASPWWRASLDPSPWTKRGACTRIAGAGASWTSSATSTRSERWSGSSSSSRNRTDAVSSIHLRTTRP